MVASSLLAVMVGVMGVMGVMGVVGVPGVGGGAAHAQPCDPVEVAKLLADDGAAEDDFGRSVSISGDTAVIGAWWNDDNGERSGSAYIFVRSGGVWTQQAKLLPDDGATGDEFGFAVSISGDTAVIGAVKDDDNGSNSGSTYVFIRSGGVWTQQAKLSPVGGVGGDEFGYSVSISGDTVLIGAEQDDDYGVNSGSAYIFTRSGSVWMQQAQLLPADGVEEDRFGCAVFISGNTAIIGAYRNDDNGDNSGSAYIFTRSSSVWAEQAKLLPIDGEGEDHFGYSVSISSNTAVIGAYQNDDNGNNSGSVYIFTRSGGVWTEQTKLLPDDGAEQDFFGHSVSISGDTIVIGAYRDDDNGDNAGAAYVFTRSNSVWTEQAKLLRTDGALQDNFGVSVSISGDTAVIGAYQDDDNGTDSGSAYIFDLNGDCPADLTGDCQVDTIDFLAFLGAWSIGDPLADWNEDGEINTLDFLAYLSDWVAGC